MRTELKRLQNNRLLRAEYTVLKIFAYLFKKENLVIYITFLSKKNSKSRIFSVTNYFTLYNNLFTLTYSVVYAIGCIAVVVFFVILVESIGVIKVSLTRMGKWLRYL
ncbi:hypothetical protein FE393_13300 [Xenorhabdus sp. psl]|nr:hypothetical protein [Xenorhabdus sp. psl]